MSGWSMDESNLKTNCVYCDCAFVPSLTVKIRPREVSVENSWYLPSSFAVENSSDGDDAARCNGDSGDGESIASQLSVSFLSNI